MRIEGPADLPTALDVRKEEAFILNTRYKYEGSKLLTLGRKRASSSHQAETELVLDTWKKGSLPLTPGRKGASS